MKKMLALVGVFALISLSACKKDHTCHCEYTDSSGTIEDYHIDIEIENERKGKAKDACEEAGITSGTITATCELE